jgi:hypothetical protein
LQGSENKAQSSKLYIFYILGFDGCPESKMLMRYPLPSRASELIAVSKLMLRAAVGLLIGHTTLTAHLYKFGHTE